MQRAGWKPSPYGVQKEALDNVLGTLAECGYRFATALEERLDRELMDVPLIKGDADAVKAAFSEDPAGVRRSIETIVQDREFVLNHWKPTKKVFLNLLDSADSELRRLAVETALPFCELIETLPLKQSSSESLGNHDLPLKIVEEIASDEEKMRRMLSGNPEGSLFRAAADNWLRMSNPEQKQFAARSIILQSKDERRWQGPLKAARKDSNTFQDVVLELLEDERMLRSHYFEDAIEAALDNPGTGSRMVEAIIKSGTCWKDTSAHTEAENIFLAIPGNLEAVLSDKGHSFFESAVWRGMHSKNADVKRTAAKAARESESVRRQPFRRKADEVLGKQEPKQSE